MRAVSNSGVAGNWSQPRNIMLSQVPSPTILGVMITQPRRRMEGDDLIVTTTVELTWRSLLDTQVTGFAITGYDAYVGVEMITDPYASPPSRNLQTFRPGVCSSLHNIQWTSKNKDTALIRTLPVAPAT